jgi:RNA polymerase sigma-70 factor (ECF subfamily)
MLRQSIRLAFVSALQHLAPKQRAVLLLMEVLGWSAAEVAETLETSVVAVNSALQRARDSLAVRGDRHKGTGEALTEGQQEMLRRYVAAFERYDVDELVSLLQKDAAFSMPPYELWLQGPEAVRTWMLGMGCHCRGSRLVPVSACGSPAFAQYRLNPEGGRSAWALIVLELAGEEIAGVNTFLDVETLFPQFGLPVQMPA